MPAGRPRKLHEVLTITSRTDPPREVSRGDYFIERLASGSSQANAAELSGLGETTVKEYVARGEGTHPDRGSDEELATFAARVREAKAQGRAIHERTIVLAGVPRPVVVTEHSERDVVINVWSAEAGAMVQQVRRVTSDKTTTREEYDWRSSAWALTNIYGVKPPVLEVEVVERPVRERVEGLTEDLRKFLEGAAAGAEAVRREDPVES